MNTAQLAPSEPVVFYDGACGLCQRSVRFLLLADRRKCLGFASLQGRTAAMLLRDADRRDLDSVVFL